MFNPTLRGSSPWGTIQTVLELAPGIVSVSTPSHGGIWISSERERLIPEACRNIARQYAPANWYEEDCDVSIVAAFFGEEIIAADPENRKFVDVCREYIRKDRRMFPVLDAMQAAHRQADPHCTCNDCIADHAGDLS